MLKIIITLGMALATSLAAAQSQENRSTNTFSILEIGGNADVILVESQTEISVVAPTKELLGQVSTRINNGVLSVDYPEKKSRAQVTIGIGTLSRIRVRGNATVKFENVTYEGSVALRLSQNAKVSGNLAVPNLELRAEDRSQVTIQLNSRTVKGDFSGQSKAAFSGITRSASFLTSHSAICHARNLEADDIFADAGEGTEITTHVRHSIAMKVESDSKIRFTGNPVKIDVPEQANVSYIAPKNTLLTQK